MADRSNQDLNNVIQNIINQWHGTAFGTSLKNMYENGTCYEDICDYADIDFEQYDK